MGPGRPYRLGSSFGDGPLYLGTRKIELALDNLLTLTVGGHAPSVFQGYAGRLDSRGVAEARLLIPRIPALKGVRIHSAFVTLAATAPLGVSGISNTVAFTIV